MTVGDKLKDQLLLAQQVQWQYKLESFTDGALTDIQKAINRGRTELVRALSRRKRVAPVSKGREEALLNELNDMTLGIQQRLTKDIHKASAIAADAAVKVHGKIVSFDGHVDGFNFISLSAEQLKEMVTAPVGGRILNDWVMRSFESAIQQEMASEILTGYLKGEGTAKMSRRLRNAFDLVKRDAETLTRTWVADANNNAAKMVYDANSDIIEGEEWCATLEVNTKAGRGTCLRCAGLDGRVYPLDEEHIRPPLHPRCRCLMVPKTKTYRELGLDIDELREVARPYTIKHGGKIGRIGDFDGTFDKWIFTQSEKYQLDVLGPNRLRLIKEGKIKFSDLVDEHGHIVLLKRGAEGYVGLASSGGGGGGSSISIKKNLSY